MDDIVVEYVFPFLYNKYLHTFCHVIVEYMATYILAYPIYVFDQLISCDGDNIFTSLTCDIEQANTIDNLYYK